MRMWFLILLVCLMLLTACGGGGSSSTDNGSLSGNWQMMLQNTDTGAIKSESGFFIQSENSLTGSILLTGDTVCAGVGSVQGKVSGTNVTMSVIQVGQTVNLTGASASSGATMSGSYSILGSPCGNSQVGTWTGTRVSPLTGPLKVTLTSTTTPGLVLNFTGKIVQGANDGRSSATLTGSITTTDPTCMGSATITGQISGTSVVLNLLTSEGVAIGQYVGTATPDATSITGIYNIFPQPPGNSCHDLGTGTVQVGPAG